MNSNKKHGNTRNLCLILSDCSSTRSETHVYFNFPCGGLRPEETTGTLVSPHPLPPTSHLHPLPLSIPPPSPLNIPPILPFPLIISPVPLPNNISPTFSPSIFPLPLPFPLSPSLYPSLSFSISPPPSPPQHFPPLPLPLSLNFSPSLSPSHYHLSIFHSALNKLLNSNLIQHIYIIIFKPLLRVCDKL